MGTLINVNIAEPSNPRLCDYVDKAYEAGRKDMKKEIMQIDLAPDVKTLETVEKCSGRFEAFGYGQGWVFKRIERIT